MEIQSPQIIYNHWIYTNPHSQPETFMMHSHNTYELIFFEKGQATYVIEGRKYQLKKNDLIFIRPLNYHYIEVKPSSEYSRVNVAFPASFVGKKLCTAVPKEIEVINCPQNGILASIFNRMEYYNKHLDEDAFTDVLSALLKEILYALSINADDKLNIPSQVPPSLSQMLDYINDNLLTIKKIKDISAHFYVSEQYLFYLFKTQLKISPRKYLNTKRLLYAQKLIQQGNKPSHIYIQCGFESYVGFYKQYVKMFGYPPSEELNTTRIES